MTFEQWLKKHHYRDSTLQVTLRSYKRALEAWNAGEALPPSARPAVQRFVTYAKDDKDADFPLGFLEWAEEQGANVVTRLPKEKPKRRKFEARSMDPKQWQLLKAALAKGTQTEDRVLYLITMSGLRVGDVLRTPRAEIGKALDGGGILEIERKGGTFVSVPIEGLEEAWRAVYELAKKRSASNVAGVVCPENDSPLAGDCAYKRLDRRLKEVAAGVGLDGRAHLHRLRRTVAVAGLRATKDLVAVQQLLGHSNITSTQRYLDEIRVDDVAKTRQLLHGVKK